MSFRKTTALLKEAVKTMEEEAGGVDAMRKQFQEEQRQARAAKIKRWHLFWRWANGNDRHKELAKRVQAAYDRVWPAPWEDPNYDPDAPEPEEVPDDEIDISGFTSEERQAYFEFVDLFFATSDRTLHEYQILSYCRTYDIDPADPDRVDKINRRLAAMNREIESLKRRYEANLIKWAKERGLDPSKRSTSIAYDDFCEKQEPE